MKIKTAVIGYGFIGKRHAKILNQLPQVQLHAIVDNDPKALQKAQKDYPKTLCLPSIETLLETHPIDAIHVCTPNGWHYYHCFLALERGCHVLCEKPLTLSYKEAIELIQKAQEQKRHFVCMLQNRWTPIAQWLKKIIEEKRLGKLLYVKVDCIWNRDERYYHSAPWRGTLQWDGGVLYTQFSHYVDLLCWLLQDITLITAEGYNLHHNYLGKDWIDTGTFSFSTSETRGHFFFSTCAYQENLESSLTLIGEQGTLKVGGQYMEKCLHVALKDKTLMPPIKQVQQNTYNGVFKGSAALHHEVIERFYKAIIAENWDYQQVYEAARSIALIEQYYQQVRLTIKKT